MAWRRERFVWKPRDVEVVYPLSGNFPLDQRPPKARERRASRAVQRKDRRAKEDTYLLIWNPNLWHWPEKEVQEYIAQLKKRGLAELKYNHGSRWSLGTN